MAAPEDDLTEDELSTLHRLAEHEALLDIDPNHFAKLLSMALIEQKPGGPELTELGRERVAAG